MKKQLQFAKLLFAMAAAFLSLTVTTANLNAQASDGNIVGTVQDSSGAVVAGATVELLNVATSVKATTKTDTSGAYRFGNVLIGEYTITVSATGFTTASMKQVTVALSRTTTANVTISVGAVSSTVEVSAATALIDTTTAQVSNTYESKLAKELTMSANPNGGIYNLALVGAGVASSGGVGVGYGPAVGGQRPRNNNFTIDGVDNNRKDVTGPTVFIPNDAVGEFTVLQNQLQRRIRPLLGRPVQRFDQERYQSVSWQRL